jgi:hypothetical protein
MTITDVSNVTKFWKGTNVVLMTAIVTAHR